jgi:hypothetical protein
MARDASTLLIGEPELRPADGARSPAAMRIGVCL